jgi:hypothetical protein
VTVDVERVHKGEVPVGHVVLEQRGGETADGATIVFGAPEWEEGDDLLLYLTQNDDGTLRVAHLALGQFRVVEESGIRYVERSEMDERVHVVGGSVARREAYEQYVARLATTIADYPDASSPRGPVVTFPAGAAAAAKRGEGDGRSDFGFLTGNFRWFEPDSGQAVRFKVNPHRAPTASGGRDESAAAAAAWSSVPGSDLRVEIVGATDACGMKVDGTNAISFDDCENKFDAPVNCTGVVGLGGVTSATPGQTRMVRGRTFQRILEGDIAINPGFECLLSNPATLGEVITHEMGHALGFGHSSENVTESNATLRDATMFFAIHNDGRGAALRDDDMRAAQFLYPGDGGSQTAGPVVSGAVFKPASGKLIVAAAHVDASAKVVVNGVQIAAPVKFKIARGTLVVRGTAADLNLRAAGSNTLVVRVNGLESNAVSF